MRFVKSTSIILVMSIIASFAMSTNHANAVSVEPNWFDAEPIYKPSDVSLERKECVNERRRIKAWPNSTYLDEDESNNIAKEYSVCVYKADGYEYAYYTRLRFNHYPYFVDGFSGESGLAFAVNGEELIPEKNFLNYHQNHPLAYLGKRKDFILQPNRAGWIMYYRNLIEHLTINSDGMYEFYGEPDYYSVDSIGQIASATGLGISENKKWLSFATPKVGVVVLNLDSLKSKRVSSEYESIYQYPSKTYRTSISDNGQDLIVGGQNVDIRYIDIDENCGDSIKDSLKANGELSPISQPCKTKSLDYVLKNNLDFDIYRYAKHPEYIFMEGDGGSFNLGSYYPATIYAENSRPMRDMRYLALGDSYASGEGDLQNKYLPGTDIWGDYFSNPATPREMCHQSSASYPYIIAAQMGYGKGGMMQSVACSGATMYDVYSANFSNNNFIDSNYHGQVTQLPFKYTDNRNNQRYEGPRLTSISNESELKDIARNDYTPGRVQQIEFVEKTKPEYLTIMMGGNDVGFAAKLMNCTFDLLGVCSETTPEGRKSTLESLHSMYEPLKDMYSTIKSKSPETRIFVIGYPEFFDEDNTLCWDAQFSREERKSFTEYIQYFNAVIKNAANDAGVKYIDISNSLLGGGVCGGGTYMSNMSELPTMFINDSYQSRIAWDESVRAKKYSDNIILQTYERFKKRIGDVSTNLHDPMGQLIVPVLQQYAHPNNIGHQQMAEMISAGLGSELLESDYCGGIVYCPTGSTLGSPRTSEYVSDIRINENKITFLDSVGISVSQIVDNFTVDDMFTIRKGDQKIKVRFNGSDRVNIDNSKPLRVEIHSTPAVLGEMRSDANGEYVLGINSIPEEIQTGFHYIHIIGTTTDGKEFDAMKQVFVAGPEGDFDDDGIVDEGDMCLFVKPNESDSDDDGIADNCDMYDDPAVQNVDEQKPTTVDNPAPIDKGKGAVSPEISETITPTLEDWSVLGSLSNKDSTNVANESIKDRLNQPKVIDRSDTRKTDYSVILAGGVIATLAVVALLVRSKIR